MDALQLKKSRLQKHVPFVKFMAKVKGNVEVAKKWQIMLNCITNDQKIMTFEQIEKMDISIKKVMVEQKKNSKHPVSVPKPENLGKPVLSSSDIKSLLEDDDEEDSGPLKPAIPTFLKLDEVKSPAISISKLRKSPANTEKSLEKVIPAKQVKKEEKKTCTRRVSSWTPSKRSSLNIVKKDEKDLKVLKPNPVSEQSLLKVQYKIPKLSQSQSSSELSSNLSSPETSKKLITINMFKNKNIGMPANPSKIPVAKVNSLAETDQESSNEQKDSEQESATKTENVETKSTERKSNSLDRKTTLELKRLQENIVKDGIPLTSRRSCTLKHASIHRDLINKSESGNEDEEKPSLKRRKSVFEGSKTVDKGNGNDRKSMPEKLKKRPDVKLDVVRSSRVTRRSEPSKSDQLENPETRKEVAITEKTKESSMKGSNQHSKKEEEVGPKQKVEQAELEEVNKSEKIPKKPMKVVDRIKTIKRPLASSRKKFIVPKQNVPSSSADDEWEDCEDEIASDQAEASEMNEKVSKNTLETNSDTQRPDIKKDQLMFTNVSRLSFAYCPSGALFKCLLPNCRFQSLQKQVFVRHLSSRHKNDVWNGYCATCGKIAKKVDKKQSLPIVAEFIHLMEDHVLKDPVPDEADLINYPNPEIELDEKMPSQDAPAKVENNVETELPSDIDDELIEGIDSILKELQPSSKFKVEADTKKYLMPKASSQQTSSIAFPKPDQLTPTTSSLSSSTVNSSETKVISKNIIGRVIPLSKFPGKLFLPNGAPLKIINPNLVPKTSIIKPVVDKISPASPEIKSLSLSAQETKDSPATAADVERSNNVPISVKATTRTPVLKLVQPISSVKSVKSGRDLMNFHNTICPWLKRPTFKSLTIINHMLSRFALSATFKCLGTTCDYFTIDPNIFEKHLEIHEKLTPGDKANFLLCSYCNFCSENGPKGLVEHVQQQHGCDKYQCSYCFYRSCVDFNVLTHQNIFHKMKPKLILELENFSPRNYNEELALVKRKRIEVVPPIICVFCRSVFYVFKTFLAHVNQHIDVRSTKCIKCGEESTKSSLHKHLVQCHGFGLFQCVYCRFGTSTFEIISSHIANEHASKLPLFCERSENKSSVTQLDSSIESTCLKHINQQISPEIIQKAPCDENRLLNYNNKGNVGKYITVQEDILKPKIPAKAKELMDSQSPTAKLCSSLRNSFQISRSAFEQRNRRSESTNLLKSHEKPKRIHFSPQTMGLVIQEQKKNLITQKLTDPNISLQTKMSPINSQEIKMRKLSEISHSSEPPRKLQKMQLKPLGLQIESVYSLSSKETSMTRFTMPSLQKMDD